MDMTYLWAGFAIGFAAIGAAIGQGILVKKAIELMGKDPTLGNTYLTIMILWVALVESVAIYGLIIAFQILGADGLSMSVSVGAGLAIGLAGLWVWIGEGLLVAGWLEAMNIDTENRNKILTFMILFLALVESAAIYGVVTAFQVLGLWADTGYIWIGAGLAVWLAGLWVGIGEWILAQKALINMGKSIALSPLFLVTTILGIALVESAAIYGLIVAFQMIGQPGLSGILPIAAWCAIWLAALGTGVGEGNVVSSALSALYRNPQNKDKIITSMILGIALVESVAIYGLIVAFQVIG